MNKIINSYVFEVNRNKGFLGIVVRLKNNKIYKIFSNCSKNIMNIRTECKKILKDLGFKFVGGSND